MFSRLYSLSSSDKKVAMMCSSLIEVKTIVDIIQRYLPTKTIRYYIGYDGDMLKDDEGDISTNALIRTMTSEEVSITSS